MTPDRTRQMTPARRRMLARRRRTVSVLGALLATALLVTLVVRLSGPDGPQTETTASASALADSPTPAAAGASSSATSPAPTPAASTPGTAASGAPSTPGTSSASNSASAQSTEAIARGTGKLTTTIPASGSGETTVLALPGSDSTRTGRTIRYTVEVEKGLGVPQDHVAHTVRAVLTDARGWEERDGVHFVNVTPAERAKGESAQVRIVLGSPAYVDRRCLPLRTGGTLSCHADGKVLLNVRRWAQGADTYGDDITNYRIYLINHEVGHALGHGHRSCPGAGKRALVMIQQTKSLGGCTAWPWPTSP